MNAKQLRCTKPTDEDLNNIKRNPIYIILDNVLDTYNIGAIFRLADATAATEMILCGGTETPPSSRIHKAAVGTEEWVKWRYTATAVEAIANLKKQIPNIQIISVEQDPRSMSIFNFKFLIFDQIQNKNDQNQKQLPAIAIVVGHETEGVSKEALDASDVIVEMPMYGANISMNVMVSTGIMLYKILEVYEKNN